MQDDLQTEVWSGPFVFVHAVMIHNKETTVSFYALEKEQMNGIWPHKQPLCSQCTDFWDGQ